MSCRRTPFSDIRFRSITAFRPNRIGEYDRYCRTMHQSYTPVRVVSVWSRYGSGEDRVSRVIPAGARVAMQAYVTGPVRVQYVSPHLFWIY